MPSRPGYLWPRERGQKVLAQKRKLPKIEEANCAWCGVQFETWQSDAKNPRKYCKRECELKDEDAGG